MCFGAFTNVADELRVGIAGRNSSWGRQPASVMPEPNFIEIGSMCKAQCIARRMSERGNGVELPGGLAQMQVTIELWGDATGVQTCLVFANGRNESGGIVDRDTVANDVRDGCTNRLKQTFYKSRLIARYDL